MSELPLLRIESLVKAFHGNRAVDDVSFDVPAGRIVALLGENGAGKSTVIKMLAGVYPRDAGRILFDGAEMTGRDGISFIHQDLGLVDWMTVAENIALVAGFPGGRRRPISWRATRRQAAEILALIGGGIDPDTRVFDLPRTERVQHREPMPEVAVENWDRVLQTNLTSAFLVSRAVAAGMVIRGHGKIVNICSVQTWLARPGIAAYAASKAGLAALTRGMCAEWAGHGLTVNGLAPGYMVTERTKALVDDPAFDSWIRGRTPAGRWATVGDLVGTLIWLAAPASDFVNGQVIAVDGGLTAVV